MKNSLSVITVVFNNRHTILDTLHSVRLQTGVEEHLIIDGGSTDGTLEIIRRKNSPLVKLISEPDEGIYDAMNKGIRQASGDIISFLNSDDVYYDQDVVTNVRSCFRENPTINIVYGDLLYVEKEDLQKVVRRWESKPYHSGFFEEGFVPPHPSLFVKRDTLLESGGFDLRFKIASDYELMLRLLKVEGRHSLYFPQFLVRMRLGGESNRSIGNVWLGNKEIRRAWKKHKLKIPPFFWMRRYYNKVKQFL